MTNFLRENKLTLARNINIKYISIKRNIKIILIQSVTCIIIIKYLQ